ncbi:WD40 repeat-like protein [Coprinopsis marcescibilis]|uniref:WD40 repeat-like protein n=1 Tax=Coprinopsis marcescibilis TaxID=230819 RepID=A0A5C3L5S5_COPMA|nr:WD40 repeat-like protein [Coprinopsis marcescibilis]
MDRVAEPDGTEEFQATVTNDNEITVEARTKVAPKVENAKEQHCGGCCLCIKVAPKVEIVIDTCGSHVKKGRNLIICIDGTANQFGNQNTNVIELYNLLLKDPEDEQLTWYNSGIGTYAEPHWRSLRYWLQVLLHKIDLAIAWNFDKTILGAYGWLAENYRKGDCIYLFGFSRGAFQVRALSAMIDQIGLIHKGNEMQIPFAYQLYARSGDAAQRVKKVGTSEHVSKTERFKKAFSREVKVHFVGAWDTVSSIGTARGKHTLPGTTEGMQHVCYFRHALALDERRVKFLPEYAWGGSAVDRSSNDATANQSRNLRGETKESDGGPPHTVETWFPGTHSDIGGGNRQNEGMDRSRPPLRWMVSEARAAGLRTREFDRELLAKEHIEIQESLTGVWHLFELLPFLRLTYTVRPEGSSVRTLTRRPHCWASRKIHHGQKIHPAVLVEEMRESYLPQARLALQGPRSLLARLRSDKHGREMFWDTIRKDGLNNADGWLLGDLSSSARVAVRHLVKRDDKSLIEQIMGFKNGPQALTGAFVEVLEEDSHQGDDQSTTRPSICQISDDNKCDLLGRVLQSTHTSCDGTYVPMKVIKPFVDSLLTQGTEEHKRVARKFLQLFSDMCILQLKGHTLYVTSVAFTPDCKHVVSGSWDNTIRIWDAATGQGVREPLRGHNGWIWSVAVSADSQRIVSGSDDHTVRIWDARTRQEVAPSPLRGSTYPLSVAISPDGSRIVAGSADGMIHVWDAETGESTIPPLKGHEDWVRSVVISPDGNRIVSGSHDCTVRVWDIRSGAEVKRMTGNMRLVRSVAISPDGSKIVSGSADETVRIWDAKTGQQVGKPLLGHTYDVNSVVFSPDGRQIVSGSDDRTIRIWDVETGKQVGKPLKGHTYSVKSVAISSDGKLIASGSGDNTIRIWDGELALSADLVED